ncbi:unnamed protein product [Phaedon cochleariae]|uniref:Uncharacterized protein n=1 Tax=Phaedon cochleariae TaxID=80249 RepID=A0A9N9SEJ6_PHACE|nr:unnamed protein product [Phaedon cochleariae]
MYHMYPLAKGDPLCPLGFHPQVRWPTRCKRCFRDYKEHGGKKRDSESNLHKDASTLSTPSLSLNSREGEGNKRIWVSSTNLTAEEANQASNDYNTPSSWTSTKDLANIEDDTQPVTTVNLLLPKRKIKPLDTGQKTVSGSFSLSKSKQSSVFNKSDSLAIRAKKLQSIKESTLERGKRIQIKEVKTISDEPNNHDVQFLIQVKSKPNNKDHAQDQHSDDDNISLAGTETTDTTLVDAQDSELREQLESLKKELDITKMKCERLERDKSDILLRRLAAMETTTSKTTASEALKLQQKCNELQQQLEDYRDDKKSLTLKVRELEHDLDQRPTPQEAQKITDDLRSKLLAAETLCEELMDENEDIKKELRDMEEQMDELQDNFREDQAVEYTSIKKDLDQTTKNCRILSFKLRKAERKSTQLEFEKAELEKKLKDISGSGTTLNQIEKIKQLEQELKVANEVSLRLQKELDEAKLKISEAEDSKGPNKKKAPLLGSIGKSPSADGKKVSRESLTRGGSQDDPVQLLRDLQDSLEREADLREQLKFAEEEAQTLQKKVSRIEDDNESLVLQLKKMASRARTRKLSPTNQRLTPEPPHEKGDFSDDDDPAEMKLQLELSEQEASVLRHKVEELEGENHKLKAKIKDLQDRSNTRSSTKRSLLSSDKSKENSLLNQKLKVLEDETNDIRKKLIEKERDCERLHAELSLTQKRSKGMQKSKSLDLDQQTLDLRRQLQVIDQEASVLRNKIQSLETENEKLSAENKKLNLLKSTKTLRADKNMDRYIDQIASLEIELKERNDKIKELEELLDNSDKSGNYTDAKSDYKKFSQRTPKRITALTSRDQMKAMVSDLEKEIAEMLLVIKTNDNAKIKSEEEVHNKVKKIMKELEEMNKKYNVVKKELEEEKCNSDKASKTTEEVNKELSKIEEQLKNISSENSTLQAEIEKTRKEKTKIIKDKKTLDDEISKLKADLKASTSKQNEMDALIQKVDSLKLSLEKKEKEISKLELDITKVSNENSEKVRRISELESQLTIFENRCNECDKKLQEQNRTFETKIDIEKQKIKVLQSDQSKWEEERKILNSQLDNLAMKIDGLENTIKQKDKLVKQLEINLDKEREVVSKTNLKASEIESREISKLKNELTKGNVQVSEIESKLEIANKSCKTAEDKLSKIQMEINNIKSEKEKKVKQMEIDLQNEKKKLDILRSNNEKEQKNRELELTVLREKIKKLEQNGTGSPEVKQLQKSITELETTIIKERRKYDELTAKYEILEEEHVITKAKLVMERETVESQNKALKREIEQIEGELKTVRDTYNIKHDTWIKEKLEMEARLKELFKSSSNGSDSDRQRLRALLEEKQSEYDQIKKEHDNFHDQVDFMRKENEDLRRKLDDYEKVNKIQRNISADSSAMEKEMKQLRMKVNTLEKNKKSDLAELKMRYESQINVMNGELQSLQNQVVRFKREKDTYKHMLETAQKTIGELKQSPRLARKGPKNVAYDELEESKSKVATLEQQISCMEDELSEARLECSRLKTELVSERSSWEIKLSELHSKVNELEEEKVLNSGRTKIVGLRTKMELAWQKEREEQQRLLQETATLARDLRQTLFEVERERDKEKLEAKRKQDQLKKTADEEQDENKKKLTELQCDLLELRDAHAKLRTTNEKLRRERERYDKEREENRLMINGKKRINQEDDRKINALVEQMDTLKQLAPELFFSKDNEAPYTPTPPRRTKSKSRETSPALERRETSVGPEEKQQQIQYIMQRLVHTTEDLRKFQKLSENDIERERLRRMGVRRATSTEHDNGESRYRQPYLKKPSIPTHGSLKRKSISLEHTIQAEQNIWTNDNSMSSLNSLELHSDIENSRSRIDVSLDSRLSNESTQSEIGEKKKKKSFMGKLKKLTKSRSIDDQDPGTFSPTRNLSSKTNSQAESVEDTRGSKKDLKERITGIFKKSGSSSRSNSVERRYETSSTQRPLIRNGSNGHLTSSDLENSHSRSKKS